MEKKPARSCLDSGEWISPGSIEQQKQKQKQKTNSNNSKP